MRKVVVQNNGCHYWCGSEDGTDGYGRFYIQGKKAIPAHRFAWFLHTGIMPSADIQVCHTCDRPRCVNPAHLFLGTNKTNAADREQKGRGNQVHGESHVRAKLNPIAVRVIRHMFKKGKSLTQLGRIHKVATATILNIVKEETWKHLKN